MKLKIIHKLLILFISVSLFIYTISILYINLSSRDNFIQDAKELANSYSREYANVVTSNLHLDIGITRALAASFLGYRAFPENIRQDLYNEMLVKTFEQNSEYLAVWTSWELNTYQTGYDKDYGRRRTVVNQSKDKKLTIEVKDLNLMGDDKNSQYYKIKQQKCEFITDPYYYSYPNALGDSIMEVSIGTPIIENDKFVGLVGVDVELTKYQRFMQRFKPYGIGYAFLIANDGTVVGHPLNNFIGKKISLVYPLFEQNHGITDKIKNATPYSFDYTDYKTDNNYYVAFAPVVVGTADTPWSLGIVIPFNKIQSQANRSIFISLAVAFISIILLMFAISLISGVFIRPLNKTNRVLQALATLCWFCSTDG